MQIVIGTGGLAKQSINEIRELNEKTIDDLVFFDDTTNKTEFSGYKVINDIDDIPETFHFVICIGNPVHRKKLNEKFIQIGGIPLNLFSSKSLITNSNIGNGNVILANSILEMDSVIGNNNLINVGSSIFHDVKIGDNNELMPGCKLLGCSSIGSRCRIGTNAVILPNINICDDVIIGAGAVVIEDIVNPGTYVGVPAKLIESDK